MFFSKHSMLVDVCFRLGIPALTCQVHLPMGSWFVDGNIFMKSGVHLNGRCVPVASAFFFDPSSVATPVVIRAIFIDIFVR